MMYEVRVNTKRSNGQPDLDQSKVRIVREDGKVQVFLTEGTWITFEEPTANVTVHEGSDGVWRPIPDSVETKTGFMCAVDFRCELGEADGGVRVFADEEDLRKWRKCVDQCGFVEVEVRVKRAVQKSDY